MSKYNNLMTKLEKIKKQTENCFCSSSGSINDEKSTNGNDEKMQWFDE